jgi:TolA-binding protein
MEQKKVVKKVVKKEVQNNKFIDTLKKNWKNILLILLVLFSMSKCTSSCSRGKQIDRLNYQIVQMDSVITSNGIELDKLNTRLDDAQTSIDSYKGIATGNQRDLVDKISTLTEEKRNLESQLRKEKADNKVLQKRISELEKQIEELNKDTE